VNPPQDRTKFRAATAGRLVFRSVPVDFPLNVSVVRCYADDGKPGSAGSAG